jgi:hypothetical protein
VLTPRTTPCCPAPFIFSDQQDKIDHKQETVAELALLEGMMNVKL